MIAFSVAALLAFAPIFPHTLYCWDEPIRPPYRDSYLAYSTEGPGSTESFGITTITFGGRAWLRFWPWLTDEQDVNENVFFKAAVGVAAYEVEVDGVRYSPPPEGVALAEKLRRGAGSEHFSCNLAAIGARDVPPGTPWR
jgi:hypothetical protein